MFTVVTAFFDIERDRWTVYQRSKQQYLQYFSNILQLHVNMIVYVEEKTYAFVDSYRTNIPFYTSIRVRSIPELKMYEYYDRIIAIQNNPDYAITHPNPIAPEISIPLYNIVTCSKMDLVHHAVQTSDFEYYIWLDAGYTHGTINCNGVEWNPTSLFQYTDKLSVIALQPLSNASYEPRQFFLQYTDVIIGGFFGGTRSCINQVHGLYYDLVEEMLERGIKDDDQYYNTILAKRHPRLFHIINASWYDALSIM